MEGVPDIPKFLDRRPSKTVYDTALELIEELDRGVFPLNDKKIPLTPHGFKDATADEDELAQLFRGSASLVGIPTGNGLVVVDIDRKGGKDGSQWPELNELPLLTRKVRTRTGGEHWYYRLPEGVEVACSANTLFPGVDIRGDGGYVAFGPGYSIIADEEIATLNAEQAQLISAGRPGGLNLPKAPGAGLEEISDGNWHEPVRNLVARFVAKGLGREEVIGLAKAWKQPGYSLEQTEREVAKFYDTAAAKGFAPEPRSKRRPFQTISEVFYAEPIEWLVEGLIPRHGVGLISGVSGSFKSFLSGYLALCVTNGADFAGRCVTQPGRALFAAHEGRQGMAGRLLAACKHYGFQESKFSLWDGVTLGNESDIEYLADASQRFDLTVIDTLSKATPGIDENSNSEMAAALDRAYKLADLWKGFVLIVCHSGKDETKGPRGASALKANVDTVMLVKRSAKAMFVNLSLDKQKDGPDELRFDFKMEEVDITNEETGEVTTELVPVAVGNKASALELIKLVLNENGEMTGTDLQLGVTHACIANRDKPVTTTAFTSALSRGRQRGEIIENNGKLRLVGALTL